MNNELFEMLKKTNEFLLILEMLEIKPDTYGSWVMKDDKPQLFITNTEIENMKLILKKLKGNGKKKRK